MEPSVMDPKRGERLQPLPPRGAWMRCWSAVPAGRVRELATALGERYRVEDLQLPQAGLGLLPLTDSALGERYFLGEIPLAKAHVRLTDGNGATTEGAAVVMDDRITLVRALAILDAVAGAAWPGSEGAAALLREGEQAARAADVARRKLLSATRVDFSLLSSQEDD